ncbi:MAG: TrmB family transcriptional regulator [Solirubrobacterales bacterium]
MEEILSELQKIGFTSYEAKIYTALLKHNPATGYEISRISSVPQAKVYENILRLVNQGVVLSIGNDPVKYVPIPPEELLQKVNIEFDNTINKLKKSLPSVKIEENANYAWNIKGYYFTMEKAARMIKNAKKSIIISIWDEDAMYIYNEFIDASARGVKLNVLIHGNNKIQGIQNIYYYGADKDIEQMLGSRLITLVIDEKEALTGQISEESGVSIYTINPAIVHVCKEYIKGNINEVFTNEI